MIDAVEVIIRQPGFPERTIPLAEGRTRMGRSDDNEIVLADVGVSRRHAQLVFEDGRLSVEDLGSGNGTYYFGHRVKSQPLRDGDEVVIDPFVLSFRVIGGDGIPDAGVATVPSETIDELPRLEVVVGNGMAGNLFPIMDRGLTLGRAEDRDVVLPDAASSRHHCHINLEGGEYVLHDNGSANGVFVNAVRVRECTLSDGDLLRIGNTELRFTHPNAPATQEHPGGWSPADDELPSEPAVPDDMAASPVRPPRVRANTSAAPSSGGGRGGVVLGAVISLFLAIVLAGTALVGLVAVGFWVTTGGPQVTRIAPTPPRWELTLPDELPASDASTLFDEGSLAAQGGDYRLALQDFYRVLSADPGHRPAKKFSAFTAEVLVAQQLNRELTTVEDAKLADDALRDKLIDRAKNSRNNRVRTNAKRELTKKFREDPIARDAMGWKLTDRQLGQQQLLARIEKHVKTDEYDEAIRLSRKLLDESTEPELRDAVEAQMLEAQAKQSRAIAEVWRRAVMNEALGDKTSAIAGYKAVIKKSPTNVSATLRLARLESE